MNTQTYATLELSRATFMEIKTKLKAAGYHHAFIQEPDRELICLNGIAASCGDLTRVLDTKSAT